MSLTDTVDAIERLVKDARAIVGALRPHVDPTEHGVQRLVTAISDFAMAADHIIAGLCPKMEKRK